MPKINFTLNGKPTASSFEPGMDFLELLREGCGVSSVKNGCAPEGACGCCTILVDGYPALSCLRNPEQMEGHEVITLEGLSEPMRRILGEAFAIEGGVQCGFCIPGIVVRASVLMRQGQADNRDAVVKALDGHLCRCTGYARIIDAILTAGEAWKNREQMAHREPRRHFFFGEEFGICRNPAFATRNHTNGVGESPCRYNGFEQALGEKPFVDDMRVPGMLHAAQVLSAHPRA
ncbi:MAG: 2Fe-2S iron-sulfur cluster-binding protein, partial [Terriglobia bacterium]